MAWKILASFAAIFLAVSGVFRYLNYEDLKTEKMLARRADKNLKAMGTRHEEVKAELATTLQNIDDTSKERDKYKADTETKKNEIAGVERQITAVTATRDALNTRLENLAAVEAKIGPLEDVIADIKRLVAVKESTDEQIASTRNELSDTIAKTEENQATIDDLKDLERRQNLRIMDKEFTANVSRVYGNWGFVVINAGNTREVYANAELEVIRGGDVIGKLRITNVEPNVAVCDILKDTFADGLNVRQGDTVKSVEKKAPTAPEAAPPTTPVAPPTTPAAPTPSDPFGAPPGGGMTDPFGAPAAPSTPAAPAPAAPDPFAAP